MTITEFHDGSVRGFLHQPEARSSHGLVLTHGAGGNAKMPLLVAVAEAFAAKGFVVLRCDLPFRQKRPNGPPSPSAAAADQAGLRDAAQAIRSMTKGSVFIGGQSYGGRQATMLVADDPVAADGLVLLSYPLHPPGRADKPRTAHLPALTKPAVFVSGSKDAFGSPEELRAAIELIPAQTELVIVEGAGHELARGKFDATKLVVEPLLRLVNAS